MTLRCDMMGCDEPIGMIDDRGFVYCFEHGWQMRSWHYRRCRKLRPHELNRLARGDQIAHY